MLNRAVRHGRLTVNLVKGVSKSQEPEGRTLYLMRDDEQRTLRWTDVDFLTGLVTVRQSR